MTTVPIMLSAQVLLIVIASRVSVLSVVVLSVELQTVFDLVVVVVRV